MPRTLRAHTFLVFLYLAFFGALNVAAEDRIEVVLDGGSEEIRALERDRLTYISLSELADVIGGALDWETIGHSIIYAGNGDRIRFLLGSPWIQLNDSAFNLIYPVELVDGQLFVPATTFTPFLDRIIPQQVTWVEDTRRLQIDTDIYTVTDLLVSPKANGLLIEIYLTTALSYEAFVTEGNYLNVSIRNGVLNRSRILARRDRRFMYDLNAYQVTGAGQISIRLKTDFTEWHHRLLHNPPRIQITIADPDFDVDSIERDTQPTVGPDDKIDVIVIDAGHGGRQYGAIGPGGTREKDIALDIAHKLAKLIRKDKQFKVIMTRDRDKTVSLEERARIANEAGCDLFLSIHANSSTKRHVSGWNVFFLAPARNDSARAVAQFENSAFLRDQSETADPELTENTEKALFGDPVLSILNEMIMTEFQTESYDFAMMCDKEFRRGLKTTARGVDQAGFFVLNRVYAPSVLIESGFISNKSEERLLKTSDYQEAVAQGLYDAIKRFKAKYERYAEGSY